MWGRDGHEMTGVEPYVHEAGARPPSLRRLYRKSPYFTNGSAGGLAEVLSAVRVGEGFFLHRGAAPGGRALYPGEREALLAFLRLL